MKLKSLELSGFKSFADKTVIEFQDGMTGIVGPNGSGKSNIIEAIRWVMGEQSAKGLRGDKMVDVIFGGSGKRSQLNRAEVTIVFDNSDHYLKSDYTEIQVSRKIYRDGSSKYTINGIDARLRDVTDLFVDTGIGRESFSIISQGRVEEIFNAKPEERRSIIEEVAGVYKYKKDKEKAERELAITEENLLRVEDIASEIEGCVEPLKQQAQTAQEYLVTKERFDTLDKSRLFKLITNSDIQIQEVEQKLAVTKINISDVASGIEQIKSEITSNQNKLSSKRIESNQLKDQLSTLTSGKERLLGQKNLNQERVENRNFKLETINQQLQKIQNQIEDNNVLIEKLTLQNQELQDQLIINQSSLDDFLNQDDPNRILNLRNDIQTFREKSIILMKEAASLQNEQDNLLQTHNNNQSSLNNLNLKIEKLSNDIRLEESEAEQLTDNKLVYDIQDNLAQLEILQNNRTTAMGKAEELRNNWLKVLSDHNNLTARLHALKSEDGLSAYFNGVKNTLAAKNKFSGIVGVITELIKVDPKYNLAIETLLGSALQQIVVDKESTAKQIVKYLTENKMGRATFLPIDTIKPKKINADNFGIAQRAGGFIALATELIEVKSDLKDIISYLLGNSMIATDLSAAANIAKALNYKSKVVSLDGQIVNAGGSITGGATRNSNNGLLNQQNQIQDLQKQIKISQDDVDTKESNIKDNQQTIKSLESDIEKVNTELIDQQQKEKVNQNQLKNIQAKIDNDKSNLVDLQNQVSQIESQIEQFEAANTELIGKIAEKTQESENAIAQINQKEEHLATLTDTNSSNYEQIATLREEIALKTAESSSIQVRLNETHQTQLELNQQLEQLQLQNKDLDMNRESQEVNFDEQLKQVEEELRQTKENSDKIDQEIQELEAKERDFNTQLVTQQTKQSDFLTNENDLEINKAKLATRRENLVDQLQNDYQLTIQMAQNDLESLELEVIENELKEVKAKINILGNVNLNAIEEYEVVSKRSAFLQEQRDDLNQAREKLLATMGEMDQEVQLRFKKTFDEIAHHFAIIFERMFGGGKARLTLTDPDNLLTSGIDITAQPPGKKFQSMNLLSGGEKALTAITLLFAILAARPVPFAILDETEAALDEANVDRFAKYLHDFAGDTQFIVITHRKGTMVNANVLYGVTMQESGVSKMVSVELENYEEAS